MVIGVIVIIIVIIFYLLNKYLENYNEYENFISEKDIDIDIIVARYNEDLKWTLEFPFNKFKYIVYNKGINNDFEMENVKKVIPLENVGKCDHTYLYHIINNYDNLADINVFFPGSIDMIRKKKIARRILNEIQLTNKAVFISYHTNNIKKEFYNFELSSWKTSYYKNSMINQEITLKKSEIRPYGLWYSNLFGDIEVSCFIYYGIFSISKKDIIQHPKTRYETLIKDLSDHSNPEVGHYFERSWCVVFHPLNDTNIIKIKKIK
jgi:hypothetical protein